MNKPKIKWKETFLLRSFGTFKVPMIGYIKPRVIELNDENIEILVPLSRRTKNHLGCMYFGALTTAADVACGILAFKIMYERKAKVNFVFKDIQAEFLKRAEGDVHFICKDGLLVAEMMEKAINSDERHEAPTFVEAIVPSQPENNPVAKFKLTLSVKKRRN